MLVYRVDVRWEGSNVAWVSTGHAPPSAADDGGERRRGGDGAHQRAGARARAGLCGEAWRAAPGLRRALLFGPTGPSRCDHRDRGDQRGGRHQGARRRQDRADRRRRAVDAGRRHDEVEKVNTAGLAAIVGGYGGWICLTATETAARYDLPYLVDVGVADNIVTRGLKNTFRFGPGIGVIAKTALDNLVTINDQAGKPAKTVMIVHEDSLFGSGLAKMLNAQLPEA